MYLTRQQKAFSRSMLKNSIKILICVFHQVKNSSRACSRPKYERTARVKRDVLIRMRPEPLCLISAELSRAGN